MIICPVCNSTKTKKYFSNDVLTLFKCKGCGLKFQHPMPTPEALNQVYSSNYHDFYYPERILAEQELLFHHRLRILEKLRNGDKGKALDVGSGKGIFLKVAKERGWDCIGQEFSNKAAQDIKKRIGADVIVCDNIADAQFKAESFDLVHMNHVLEHLYNPEQTIRDIYRTMKPGCLFYCEVPRQNNLLNSLSKIFGRKDFGFNYKFVHLFLFDIPSLRILLEKSGFEILYMGIESIGDPHRYVYGVHYTSFWTRIVAWVVGTLRLQVLLGGGNLVIMCRKAIVK